jgi:hypothetical protein
MLKFCVLTILFLLTSCKNSIFEDCAHGKPKPLYDTEFPGVKTHEFEIKTDFSIENVSFTDNYEVTVLQSGCEKFTQEFIFNFNSPPYFSEDWQFLAIRELEKLGNQRNDNIAYTAWANLIQTRIDALNNGGSVELTSGFFASIKMNILKDAFQIVIKLSEESH